MNKLAKFYRRQGRTTIVIVVGLAACVFLLLYRLSTVTNGLSLAELKTVQGTYGWHGIWQQPLNLPLNAMRSLVFVVTNNHDVFVSRLPSAIFGLLSIIGVTTVIYLWHGRKTAIFIGILYACSAWTLHSSRLATNDVIYLWALPVLWLCQQLSGRRPGRSDRWYGLILVSGLLLYIPGMVWLTAITLYFQRKALVLGWRRHRQWWQRTLFVLAGLVWLPLLALRLAHVSTLKTWLGLPQHVASLGQLGRQFVFVPIHLLVRGPNDANLWLGHAPILDAFTLAMVAAGLYFYVRHYKASRSRVLATYFGMGWLLVALGGPVSLSFLVPLFYLVAATGITFMLHDWLRVFPRNPLARSLGNGLIIVAVLVSCTYNLASYFVAWPNDTTTLSTFRYEP